MAHSPTTHLAQLVGGSISKKIFHFYMLRKHMFETMNQIIIGCIMIQNVTMFVDQSPLFCCSTSIKHPFYLVSLPGFSCFSIVYPLLYILMVATRHFLKRTTSRFILVVVKDNKKRAKPSSSSMLAWVDTSMYCHFHHGDKTNLLTKPWSMFIANPIPLLLDTPQIVPMECGNSLLNHGFV